MRFWARQTLEWFATVDDTGNNDALGAAQKINETLEKARNCLFQLYDALCETEGLTDEVKQILHGHESQISELERINIEADRLQWVDNWILSMQSIINLNSHQITFQFPGVLDDFDLYYRETPIPFQPPCRTVPRPS